jgi:hypothetical protein
MQAVEGTEGKGEEQRKEGTAKSRGKSGICEVLKQEREQVTRIGNSGNRASSRGNGRKR